jgi:hypothetical protein
LAFCQKHNVAEQDISRLYVAGTDDPHVQRLSFLRTEKNASALNLAGFKQLDSLLVAIRLVGTSYPGILYQIFPMGTLQGLEIAHKISGSTDLERLILTI